MEKSKRIGLTVSSFDLLHGGHVSMLKEAREQCDHLIVLLLNDPTTDRDWKNKPVQSLFERWLQLDAIKYVDQIIPIASEQEICDAILTIKPDIRIVGEDYVGKDFTGKDLCEVYYNSRQHSFSSTDLRQRVASAEQNKAMEGIVVKGDS